MLPDDRSPIELVPLCWRQWPSGANPPESVLLILDDQPGDSRGYGAERKLLEGLPGRFRRLITQREAAPTGAQSIDLPLLKRDASLELLALQAGEDGSARVQAEEQAAHALCSEVGDLPLALVLLGARLAERPDLRLASLLQDLEARGAEARALIQAHPELGARLGVVESLLISWEPLSAPAQELALLLSVMAPAVIPWDLVEACRREDQELVEASAFWRGPGGTAHGAAAGPGCCRAVSAAPPGSGICGDTSQGDGEHSSELVLTTGQSPGRDLPRQI